MSEAAPALARVVEVLLAAAVRASGRREDVAAALSREAKVVERDLVCLVLRVATEEALGVSTSQACQWMRGAGMQLLGAVPDSPLADPGELLLWAGAEARSALLSSLRRTAVRDGAPDVGALYQELLELRVHRLDGTAIWMPASRTWVSTEELLAQARSTRSKWLQRRLGLPKSAVQRLAARLADAGSASEVATALQAWSGCGLAPGQRGDWVLEASAGRRRSGAHYTPAELCRRAVDRTLAPLLEGASSDQVLALRICDPAMGSGAFLVAAAELLAERVCDAWRAEGRAQGAPADARREALRLLVPCCLHGVDRDPLATELARWTLARLAWTNEERPPDLSARLRTGDALVGRACRGDASLDTPHAAFDWPVEFPAILGDGAGFDACVGNPPWVAFVGRATQPIAPELFRYYERMSPAFRGYRTLHGVFVRRAAEVLRVGGRLGFVLPTSVADLDGYLPTRRAHDALCDADAELTDFGDGAFEGVFQPCMALTSTRRRSENGSAAPGGAAWTLARTDLGPEAVRLLSRLSAMPQLPQALFGERGFQSTEDDLAHLRRLDAPEPPFTVPIHEGVDVAELLLAPPRAFMDARTLRGRLRPPDEWANIAVLIRQTARYPIASLSDGVAFRNSILAGFASREWPAAALAAYLNSSAVRWFHYARHRDARQGMPQLKIGHLRALPDPEDASLRANLDALGRAVSRRKAGITATDRETLDGLVFDSLRFTAAERQVVIAWTLAHPVPRPRKKANRH